jgi:phosphoglycerate dehydrogenase-like enzyme
VASPRLAGQGTADGAARLPAGRGPSENAGVVFRVAVLDDYQRVALSLGPWERLDPSAEVTCFHDHVSEPGQLVRRLRPFDAAVAMRERTALGRDVLSCLPSLRLIVTKGMANAAIDLDAAADLGIIVCGTGGWAGATATVELTWALILGVVRGLALEDAGVRHGGWQLGVGTQLAEKTLGIVGLGNIGSLVPPVGRALGMGVVAWSRNLTAERADEVGVEYLGHDEFFRTCDVITVHLKLGPRSRGYVGREELRLMKPTAFVVNTSRGPVVDETALLEALDQRWIAGAALDVFDQEPLPLHHPLRRHPRTLLSPHMGYVTEESYREHFAQAVEDIAAFAHGAPIRVLTPG